MWGGSSPEWASGGTRRDTSGCHRMFAQPSPNRDIPLGLPLLELHRFLWNGRNHSTRTRGRTGRGDGTPVEPGQDTGDRHSPAAPDATPDSPRGRVASGPRCVHRCTPTSSVAGANTECGCWCLLLPMDSRNV